MLVKKVLIAAEIFPPDIGGPASFVPRILPYLRPAGLETKILTYADARNDSDDLLTRVKRSRFLVVHYFSYLIKLFKLAYNFDLIFCQGPIASGVPAVLAKYILRKKVLMKIVGDTAWERARNKKWTTDSVDDFQTNKHSMRTSFNKWVRAWAAKRVDLVITPSEYLKKIVSGWGVNPDKIKVIYNAFEDHVLAEVLSKEQAQKLIGIAGEIVLSVGRLAPWKGFGTLITLWPELLKVKPNLKLVIVGSGSEEKNLQELIKKNNLTRQVFLAGQKTAQEMAGYYQASSYFILNSGYEGLSHSLLEALSYDLPTAASKIGGNPEVIIHEQTGLLFEYNNVNQIKDSLLRLVTDQELSKKMVEGGRSFLSKFTFETMIRNYLQVIKDLCE